MKKHGLLLCLLFTIVLSGISVHAADLKDGFMQYKWGDSILRHQELMELYAKGEVTYYHNPVESYEIEDMVIDNVILGFFKQKFFAVYINIDTLEKYDAIKRHMQTKYGLPATKTSSKEYLTTHKWKYADVTIKLKTDQIGGKMKVAAYYRPLSKELREDQVEDIDESSFKFLPIDKNKKPKGIPLLQF